MANPKRIKQRPAGTASERKAHKQLTTQTEMTKAEIHQAMREASNAIDHLASEVSALKRIIVAERAQVIYYTERALAFMRREDVSLELTNFADLPDDRKEKYVERAIREVSSDDAVVPHSAPGQPSKIVTTEDQGPGKKRPSLVVV